MTIEEYREIRKLGMNLNTKILDYVSNKADMDYAGKQLGFLSGNKMIFDDDDETDVLMNYIIFEKNKKGKILLDKFYDSEIELEELEEEILEGLVNSYASLFEVTKIDQEKCIISFSDVFSDTNQTYSVMDINFSQTAEMEGLIYARLIPIRDIYMSTGVHFSFNSSQKQRLLSDISFLRFKSGKKLSSSELYTHLFKKSKLYGIKTITHELK